MASTSDYECIHGQLHCTGIPAKPEILGRGPAAIRGAAYLQGPILTGSDSVFPNIWATVMISPVINTDSPPPFIPGGFIYGPALNPYSLAVIGNSGFLGNTDINLNLRVGANVFVQGEVVSNGTGEDKSIGRHILARKKDLPFDMPHPNKKGWRLRHVCIEGPEIAVYCRGRIPENGIIKLPGFWEGLVKPGDLSINITPIGEWQELYVKEINDKEIVVCNNTKGSIKGDYHIVARRIDDDLIVEYEGETHEDYPGGNEGYSFNFEHNYVENLIKETVKETVTNLNMEKDNG